MFYSFISSSHFASPTPRSCLLALNVLICVGSYFRFKIDSNYVGEPPPLEVTINHLNDNIDKTFLTDMVTKFGPVEELFIYYHPTTNKHLGLGRVVFETVKSARACVEKLNGTSVMGKVLKVYLDAFGEDCRKLFEDYTVEKKPPLPPPPEEKVPPKVEVEKEKEELHRERERDSLDNIKEDHSIRNKERIENRYSRSGYGRNDYPTPSSSDMGYGTQSDTYSTNYGSTNTTPLG